MAKEQAHLAAGRFKAGPGETGGSERREGMHEEEIRDGEELRGACSQEETVVRDREERARALAPMSCSWGWFVERWSKKLVDDDLGTEASAKTVGEMPRRRGGSCERRRRLAVVSVKGALPADRLCVVRAQERTHVIAGPSLGWRAIPATAIAPSWNAVERRKGW